ncbi:MAG TPA: ABC transporter ATP-binding protein, partial [Streptosporangiales bacterium]
VVLHDLDQAAAVADRVVLLAAGAVVACGEPAEVLTPERLGAVYGVEVDVRRDTVTGVVTCRPVGRHNATRARR